MKIKVTAKKYNGDDAYSWLARQTENEMTALSIFDLVFDLKTEEQLKERYAQVKSEFEQLTKLMERYGFLKTNSKD